MLQFFKSVSTQVSLGEFELMAPVTLRLKSGSGPVTVSGLHLVGEKSNNSCKSLYHNNAFKAKNRTQSMLFYPFCFETEWC